MLVKPHLRNLFFRVTTFYRLGASLVFVVDGEATQLKWAAMETRAWEGGEGERRRRRRTGRRPHLQSYVDEVSMKLMHMYYCACILLVLLFKTTEVVQQISQKLYMYMYITAGLPWWLSWYRTQNIAGSSPA